jgi:nitrate reductase delta subunit
MLDYPSQELLDNLGEIEQCAAHCAQLEGEGLVRFKNFAAYLRSVDLIDLQGEYVQTFDLTPDNSLHLTHHLCGDDRNRGPALIELTELYRQHGLTMPERELPDYLPLVLEFLHTLPPEEARGFLAQAGHVLFRITRNLERAGSPWHGLIRILAEKSGAQEGSDEERPAKKSCESACGAMTE